MVALRKFQTLIDLLPYFKDEQVCRDLADETFIGGSNKHKSKKKLIALGVVFHAAPPPDFAENVQDLADKLAKIMSRMGDWYHNYLKWGR